MKHTKGEWAWQSFNNVDYDLVAQHGKREVILSAQKGKHTGIPFVAMNNEGILLAVNPEHPNAKLIAESPKMLNELMANLSAFESIMRAIPDDMDYDPGAVLARIAEIAGERMNETAKAIKKATV